LRRDRTPVAIVAIIGDDQRTFFSQAITAGADDVLVLHPFGLEMPKEAMRRIRTSRHVAPMPGQARLRVLYVGEDDLAFDLLADLPFAVADRTAADPDGTMSLGVGETGARADVVVVDEQPGDGHVLRVVKWVRGHETEIDAV